MMQVTGRNRHVSLFVVRSPESERHSSTDNPRVLLNSVSLTLPGMDGKQSAMTGFSNKSSWQSLSFWVIKILHLWVVA